MSERSALVRGLVSGVTHEAAAVVLSTGAMLVLVRLLTPGEYGQAAATVGVLGLLSAFRGAGVVEHALQHARAEEPDWTRYFAAGGVLNAGVCLATVGVAVVFSWMPRFEFLAPLLLVGSLGFLVDWPAQMATVKLRREMRFDRLKVVATVSLALRLVSSIAMAWLGFGAFALVVSANVLAALPMSLDFLLVERWRPERGWWRPLRWRGAGPMFVFGLQQTSMMLASAARLFVESLVLTPVLGVATYGLLNRAQALYRSTIGRLGVVLSETAYPLLPLERLDPARYARRSTRFIQAVLVLTIPGAVFVGLEGPALSRLLYGQAWAAADPLIWPATLAVACGAIASAANHVVMGTGMVSEAVAMEAALAVAGIASLGAALWTGRAEPYAWALFASQACGAGLSLWRADRLLDRAWISGGLGAALLSAALAAAVTLASARWRPAGHLGLLAAGSVFAVVSAALLAMLARELAAEVAALSESRLLHRWRART